MTQNDSNDTKNSSADEPEEVPKKKPKKRKGQTFQTPHREVRK